MPKRKTNPHLICGEIAQFDRAEWRPLMEAVGELGSSFMWMGEIELADGTSIHAYKHRMTRRYLHLAMDGRAFAYVSPARFSADDPDKFKPVNRLEALDEALYDLEKFYEAEPDAGEIAAQIDLARRHAERGEPMPVNEEYLARQRRFERVCRAARLHAENNRTSLDEARFDDGDSFVGDLTRFEELIDPHEEVGRPEAA